MYPRGAARAEQGFTLLAVIFLVAVLGVGMAALGTVWETASRREKETQLLFVGDQYRRAIESYYRATPGGVKQYPRSLEDLLLDRRFPNIVRHLRRLYPDPLTGGTDWGLVKEGEGISGVYSLSEGRPMKQGGFSKDYEVFEGAEDFVDWRFVAIQEQVQARQAAPGTKAAATSPQGGAVNPQDED